MNIIDGECSLQYSTSSPYEKPTSQLYARLAASSESHIPGHDKQLSYHPRSLTNKLLYQLRAGDADECAFCVVSDGTRQQRLTRSWRPVQEHALTGMTGS